MVTAKVLVSFRSDGTWSDGTEVSQVNFLADYADERNKEWAVATPSLSFGMTVRREIADAHFPPGRKFTVTFEPEVVE